MSEPITPAISDRICKHMNEDHRDALVIYAKIFGRVEEVQNAQMISIDSQGMNLSVQTQGEMTPVRIMFDHVLQDAQDAHHTLVDMIKQAREA
jgi:putative heme iron utilization protein